MLCAEKCEPITAKEKHSDWNDESSVQRKKDFARAQVQFLKDQGITDPERINRIFKAAGPGQIQEAWKVATCTKDATLLDVLDCILTGVGGSQDFGRVRMEQVLEHCGFYVPQVRADVCFFKALDGALEIMVPGAVELEEDVVVPIVN